MHLKASMIEQPEESQLGDTSFVIINLRKIKGVKDEQSVHDIWTPHSDQMFELSVSLKVRRE